MAIDKLDHPADVVTFLRMAVESLGQAHAAASAEDGLTGNVRDCIFGLNTAVEALAQMIDPTP